MAVPDDDNVEIGAGVSEADAGDFRFLFKVPVPESHDPLPLAEPFPVLKLIPD